jgi:hypothetical protein
MPSLMILTLRPKARRSTRKGLNHKLQLSQLPRGVAALIKLFSRNANAPKVRNNKKLNQFKLRDRKKQKSRREIV